MEQHNPPETVLSFIDREPELMAGLNSHLENHYDTQVTEIFKLDIGVYRVDHSIHASWVARIFPLPDRLPLSTAATTASSVARVLSFLKRHGFPAERCAMEDSVSQFQQYEVLATEFVRGAPPKNDTETFRKLGDLLGNLQSLGVGNDDSEVGDELTDLKGGSWHHLSPFGGASDEIAAAERLLSMAKLKAPAEQHATYGDLETELKSLRSFAAAKLPETLVHPDMVPSNIICSSDGAFIVVDWAGSGIGLRIFSLAWLLWVACRSGGLTMVDAVIEGYRRHVFLEPVELAHLPAAIIARPLTLATWEVCHGRRDIREVVRRVPQIRKLAEEIVRSATAAFAETGSQAQTQESSHTFSQVNKASPSTTDLTVATKVLFPAFVRMQETSRPSTQRLFSDPLAQHFISHFQHSPPSPNPRTEALRKLITARTLFFDSLLQSFCGSITTSTTSGPLQIVLLGAGYDTRAFRRPFISPAITIFELDHATILEAKETALSSNSAQAETTSSSPALPLCLRVSVPANPQSPEDWSTKLAAAGFKPDCPTAWIAEGVMLELDSEAIKHAFVAFMKLSTAKGSRLGTDIANPDGNKQGSLVKWLEERGWNVQVSDTREVLKTQGRGTRVARGDKEVENYRPKVIFIDASCVGNDAAV